MTTRFLKMLLWATINPITLISLFAPVIVLKIGLFKLNATLKLDSYKNSETYSQLSALATDNTWVDALLDLNIQYVVLIVTFLIILIQAISSIIKIVENHTIKDISRKLGEHSGVLTYCLISIGIIIGGLFVFSSGNTMSPEKINLYRENSQRYTSSVHPPPLTSIIFVSRVILTIYGVYLTFFIKNVLPKALNATSN